MAKNVNFKAIGLLAILVIMTSVFAGCGSSENQNIKIGAVYEITGSNATFGTMGANGAQVGGERNKCQRRRAWQTYSTGCSG